MNAFPSPFDSAWRTRLLSAAIMVRIEHEQAMARFEARRLAQEKAVAAIPFRFEDLNGQPDPERWGPVYPALPTVEKWRKLNRKRELTADETRGYGAAVHAAIRALNAVKPSQGLNPPSMCASGQPGDFSAARHRNKLRGELHSAAARDRRAWASSDAQAADYALAMEAKRARLEREASSLKQAA